MNDKVRKYSHIPESKWDRFLIDKIPNEEDLAKFEEWKKTTRNEMMRKRIIVWGAGFIGSLMISFSVISIVKWSDYVTTSLAISDSGDKCTYFIIVMLILLANMLVLVFIIIDYMKSKSWKMDYCKYGKVIDKYIWDKINIGSRDSRYYYAIVSIDEQLFKIRIRSIKNYYSLEINEDPRVFLKDNAIVFSIKGKYKLYVMKK